MVKVNPAQFIQEVRQETSKVTWPSRKETTVSTVMVFIMVFVSALYFFAADQLLQYGVKLILGFGGN
jgi:preprotein translocase subunit SecE